MAAESPGSDRAELKRLLKLASDQPVSMAFALGDDGKAIIKLHKLKPPRALEKSLKEDAEKSKNHRFGTVVLDPDHPKLVKFMVNKAVGGFSRKLVIALKGTGYSKVQIVTEDGEVEEHEEEDGEETPGSAPRTVAAGDGEEAVSRATPAQDPPGSPTQTPTTETPADAQADAPPDAATLTKDLTGLVKQMLGVLAKDPSQKAALSELATDAQVSLKRGDLAQAAAGIEILRLAIGDAGGQTNATPAPADAAGGAPDPAAAQKFRKSRLAWTATRTKVDGELQKLLQAIMDASDGEDVGADLETQFYTAVDPVLSNLDETLADALSQAANATTAQERDEYLNQARKTLDSTLKFVQGNPIIGTLDKNPFVPLALEKTLTTTLTTLSAMIR